jgi:tetratricopeptide (TPR) repeat protein
MPHAIRLAMRLKLLIIVFLLLMLPQAVSASPDYKKRGDQFLQVKKTTLAIAQYHKALEINPRSTSTYFNLAIAYYEERSLDKAIQALEKLIEIDPEDAEARYNLGCLRLYKGDFQEAHLHFQDGLRCCEKAPQFLPYMQKGLKLIEQIQQTDQSTQGLLFLMTQYGLPPLSL